MRTGSSNEYRVSAVDGYSGDPQLKMMTEVAILQSDSLMLTVAREMNLANNADFLGEGAGSARDLDDPACARQARSTGCRATCMYALVPKTDIIRISYSSLNPKLSADIVNKVIADYIQRSYRDAVRVDAAGLAVGSPASWTI